MTELRHIKETDIEEQEINKSEPTDLSSEGNPKRYISRKKNYSIHPHVLKEEAFLFPRPETSRRGILYAYNNRV